MGFRLLLFTQLFLTFKRTESRSAGRKRIILAWNSHSRSFYSQLSLPAFHPCS